MGAEPNFYQHISHSSCTLKWIKCSLPFRILFMSSESAFGRVIVITVEQALTLSVNVCSNKGSEYSHYTVIMQQREKLNSCLKYSLGGAFPGGAPLKNPPAIQETWVSIPGSRRSPGGGHGNPLQCSCLENPMDWGAWWATGLRVTKGQTRLKWLSIAQHTARALDVDGQIPNPCIFPFFSLALWVF